MAYSCRFLVVLGGFYVCQYCFSSIVFKIYTFCNTFLVHVVLISGMKQFNGRAFTHGVMDLQIDPSWWIH